MHDGKWIALIICLEAVDMDLRETKVDNVWLILGAILGGSLRIIDHIWNLGLFSSELQFLSFLLPLLLLIPFWLFRMIGAGDIKLLLILAIFLTAAQMLQCLFWTFLFGAIASILSIILSGNLSQRIQYFLQYLNNYNSSGIRVPYRAEKFGSENIYMTIPIFWAVILWYVGIY